MEVIRNEMHFRKWRVDLKLQSLMLITNSQYFTVLVCPACHSSSANTVTSSRAPHCVKSYARLENCGKRLIASSCPSGHPCARNNQAHTGRIFMKFGIWAFFENLSTKIKFSLKSDKNNRYFTWRPTYIFDHVSRPFLLSTVRFAKRLSARNWTATGRILI